MIEQTVQMGMLFDFYGQLLTERQRLIFSLYHQDDLSLGEIAEEFGVTRQAVYDIVRRSQKTLLGFEEKLGLIQRYTRQLRLLEMIQAGLRSMREAQSSQGAAERDCEAQLAELEKLVVQLAEDF